MLNTSSEFHYDDESLVMNIICGDVAIENIPPRTAFYSVICFLWEKDL